MLKRLLVATAAAAALASAAAAPAHAGASGVPFGTLVTPSGGETFAAALAREKATYGTLPIIRVFYAGRVEQWPGKAGLAKRPVVVSFKYLPADVLAGKADTELTRFFAGAPTHYDVWWSYIHEPENDIERGQYTAAAYRAAWLHVAALATAAAPTNGHLHPTLILMCYTHRPASHRDWRDYYVPSAQRLIAYDCYNHMGKVGLYANPATIFQPLTDWSKAHPGIPWAVAEVGSVLVPSDPDGTARAAWLRSVGRFLVAQHAANPRHATFGIYFDTKGAKGTDYRLRDAKSKAAWREVIRTF